MMAHWNLIVWGLCLLLAAWLLRKEYLRPVKRRLAVRLTTSLLAVLCMALLAIPLSFTSRQLQRTHEVILLTDGYKQDSVAALQQQSGTTIPVYAIANYSTQSFTQPPTVHVLGFGLTTAQWQTLPQPAQVIVHNATPTGITHVYWPTQLTQGQPLAVQGYYENPHNQPVQLQLHGEYTLLDSCTIAANSSKQFHVVTTPIHTGKAVYTLYEIANGDTLSSNAVPVETTVPTHFSALVLASSPGFENKFLINWLSDNHYSVAARTAISKNKYQYAYANRQQVSLEQLSPSLLAQFDVLLCDAATLHTLSAGEQAVIREQVASKGMGIVLMADSSQLPALFSSHAFRATQPSASPQVWQVHLPGSNSTISLPPSPLLYLQPHHTLLPVVRDAQQHLLAATGLYGMGHLVAHTFTNSYSWQLAGNKEAYAQLWSLLLQQAIRPPLTGEQWYASDAMPFVNNPVDIQLTTTDTLIPQGQINENHLSLKQHSLLPFQWKGCYWPQHAGWQAGVTTNGTTWWWYAYEPSHWQGIQAMERLHNTLLFAKTLAGNHPSSTTLTAVTTTVSPLYAWIVLLLCMGYLWWENKHGIQAKKNGDHHKGQL